MATEAVRGMIAPGSFDALAGAETAGIPFASWLADALSTCRFAMFANARSASATTPRSRADRWTGLRVLLVDDLTTDATSKCRSRADCDRRAQW